MGLAAVDLTKPQSLNRYAYVLNNPATLIDPLGLGGQGAGPPCGGLDQLPCDQYFKNIGAAPYCPPQFSSCYATLGGPIIGLNGSDVTIFTVGGTACPGGDCIATTLATGILGLPGPMVLPPNPSWWGTFIKSFVTEFSLSSARQPGESFGACVNRVGSALFGDAAPLVNALGPPVAVVSAATSVFTTSPATAALPGNVINIATGRQATTALPSLLERILPEAVAAGSVSGATAGAIEALVPVISKVAAPVTALSWGLVGGIWGSCR